MTRLFFEQCASTIRRRRTQLPIKKTLQEYVRIRHVQSTIHGEGGEQHGRCVALGHPHEYTVLNRYNATYLGIQVLHCSRKVLPHVLTIWIFLPSWPFREALEY
jgi:hypothetical protein